MAHIKLSDEVLNILKRSTVKGNVLKLPPVQLDRKLYDSVNKALVAAGGKWKTNLKGHLFEGDPMKKLGIALESGVVEDTKKTLQAFYTPPTLAARVVKLAEIRRDHRVLEPSAGNGALVNEIPRECLIVAVDIDGDACKKLVEGRHASVIHCTDFLQWPGQKFDRIVMNPPFTKNQDLKHVSHALTMLKPGGILVAIMWPNTERPAFKALLKGYEHDIHAVEAGAFKEAGTNVPTIIVKIRNLA